MKEKKEFNFAQRWVDQLAKENRKISKFRLRVLSWGIAGLLILGTAGSIPWLWEYKIERDIVLMEEKISGFDDIAVQVSRLKVLKGEVEQEQETLKLIQNSTHDPAPILDKLKDVLPAGTIVNSFSLQENTLTLSVNVPTPVDVARFWVSLRDSGLFQEVDIQTISLQDKVQTLNLNLTLK